MTPRLRNFYDLRAKGVGFRQALEASEVDWQGGVFFALILVALLCIVYLIDIWSEEKAEDRAAPYRAQAAENLAAFNHVMQGKPLLIANEWKALLTCKAQEVKL